MISFILAYYDHPPVVFLELKPSRASSRNACRFAVDVGMDRVWKNLLSGKQAVPTVACPSCGSLVPEFRIHSHLDTCLTSLPPAVAEEEAVAAAGEAGVHELSDGVHIRYRRGQAGGARGQGRSRGRGRKRREAGEKKGRDGDTESRKRAKNNTGGGENNVERENGLDAPVLSDDDDDANFYQQWEYSVAELDELAKARKGGNPLSDLQKQELQASGVLTIDRHEISAMILQLDRLLADFQTTEVATMGSGRMSGVRNGNGFRIPASNQVGVPGQASRSSAKMHTADADGHEDTQSEQGKALEAWWEQWVTVEWPEGPLPYGFHAGLPQRLQSKSRAVQDVHTGTDKVEMGNSAGQEYHATLLELMNTSNYNESGVAIREESGIMPHLDVSSTELLIKLDRREAIEVGMNSGLKIQPNDGKVSSTVLISEVPHGLGPRGGQSTQTKLISLPKPNVEHSSVAESSGWKAGPPSPSIAPSSTTAINEASPGHQPCPICNFSFPPNSTNGDINSHIDECLSNVANLLD